MVGVLSYASSTNGPMYCVHCVPMFAAKEWMFSVGQNLGVHEILQHNTILKGLHKYSVVGNFHFVPCTTYCQENHFYFSPFLTDRTSLILSE